MWKTFLQKRADKDLSMYSDFSVPKLSQQEKERVLLVEIRKGKYRLVDKTSYRTNPYKDIGSRLDVIEYYMNKLNLTAVPDCTIAFYLWDSYGEEFSFPHFSWAKPHNKKGLLFPCWTFEKWDSVVSHADKHNVPWKEKASDGYFKGSNVTLERSKIRSIMQKIFPEYVKLNAPHEPWTEMFKHKLLFDIPGWKPWSVRSPLIALSGSVPLRFLQYYPKWNEDVWIQFYEDVEEIRENAIEILGNYDKEFIPSKDFLDEVQTKVAGTARRWRRAQRIQKEMSELKEEDIVLYLEYLIKEFAIRQKGI